jgi:AAA+ superfamily predicted ATPase
LAESQAIAEQFYTAVCDWAAEIHGEVLVFDSGEWHKSQELFAAIQSATFDNLVLAGNLKDQIARDVADFLTSRALYARYGVPWKRGVLFLGPPGNGKTHTLKALLNASAGVPCLYVKSFKADYRGTDQDNIRKVFRRARASAPCLLVLEDLDSLIDDDNRSFFLNEMDGFADNAGVVTLATTNHPEKLDAAITERPSRFDRKYHFGLPGPQERLDYVHLWNARLQPELRLSQSGTQDVVAQTEGFSFAYLKELFLSATMRWMADKNNGGTATEAAGTMDAVMVAQAEALRHQMQSGAGGAQAGGEELGTDFALNDDEP